MCCGSDRLPSRDDLIEPPTPENEDRVVVVENLRDRLAETEARLERARAREAELSCRLDEMKKFVRVMAILETYLRRRYTEQQDRITRLYSSPSSSLLVLDTCDYECPWRWNLLLCLFHYYIYEIDLILGSHFFFCDNFERLMWPRNNMSTTNRVKFVRSLSILHDDHPFYIKVSEVPRGSQVHMPLYATMLLVWLSIQHAFV